MLISDLIYYTEYYGDGRFSNGYVGYDIILDKKTYKNGYLTGFVVEVLTENERTIKTLLE